MDGPVTERTSPDAGPIAGPAPDAASADPLAPLLLDRRLWRGHRVHDGALPGERGIPSGHPALDAVLPDGGFPAAALTEVFVPSVEPLAGLAAGKGELALVLPALARLAADRPIVLVAPPALPYAPALAAAGIAPGRIVVVQARDARDAAWAAEQALRDGGCGAVLAWLEKKGSNSIFQSGDTRPIGPYGKSSSTPFSLRRLQLAAEAGGTLGVLYRPWAARRSASPAALRLVLAATRDGLRVEVQKCRGSSARASVAVTLRDAFAPTDR